MKKGRALRVARVEPRRAQLLLDGLVIYGQELGELGKQLERLLRRHGVRSTFDPVFVSRFH